MKRFVLAASLSVLLSAVAAAQTFPKAAGRVNDFANVIDPATEAEIDHLLDLLEQNTSSEIAVATVASLEGISVEEYGNRLFKEWGVGRAKEDNGVLVLVAPTERKMRIEVGYGLEGVLPDGLAGEVIRDEFTPRFRENDYSGGIKNGVTRVASIVQAHQVLTPDELAKFNSDNSDDTSNVPQLMVIPFFGIFVGIGFSMLGVGLRSKTGFPVLFGSFFGGFPLLGSLAFLGKVAFFTTFPFAVLMFIVGYRAGARPRWRDAFRNTGTKGKGGSSGGWTMGGGSGGSGSSSSSSGSNSSFGGGSSGGGGASGSW